MEDEVTDDRSPLEQTFDRAAKHFTSLVSSLSSANLLYGYARYKQSTEGDCNTNKPGMFNNMTTKRKWEAWKGLSGMTRDDAMEEYIRMVEERDPSWCSDSNSSHHSTAAWARVSRLAPPTDAITSDGAFLDAVREGSVETLLQLDLAVHNTERFTDDMTGLHWAADQGHCKVAELLLTHGACINSRDVTGQTPLHYAASCGHSDMLKLLLRHGADTSLTDEGGLTAKEVAEDELSLLL